MRDEPVMMNRIELPSEAPDRMGRFLSEMDVRNRIAREPAADSFTGLVERTTPNDELRFEAPPTHDRGPTRAAGGPAFRTKSGSVSQAGRDAAEAKGQTMPGGSFPIRNTSDLSNAKHLVGRAKNPEAARRWINKRARELGEPGLGE